MTRRVCPGCQSELPAGAQFCAGCGYRLREQRSRSGWKWVGLGLVLAVVAAGLGAGIARWGSGATAVVRISAAGPAPGSAVGDGSAPEWLGRAPTGTRVLYQWAAANQQVLQYMPCFCGCGSVGHQSNYDCYYQPAMAGAGPKYDPHAYG